MFNFIYTNIIFFLKRMHVGLVTMQATLKKDIAAIEEKLTKIDTFILSLMQSSQEKHNMNFISPTPPRERSTNTIIVCPSNCPSYCRAKPLHTQPVALPLTEVHSTIITNLQVSYNICASKFSSLEELICKAERDALVVKKRRRVLRAEKSLVVKTPPPASSIVDIPLDPNSFEIDLPDSLHLMSLVSQNFPPAGSVVPGTTTAVATSLTPINPTPTDLNPIGLNPIISTPIGLTPAGLNPTGPTPIGLTTTGPTPTAICAVIMINNSEKVVRKIREEKKSSKHKDKCVDRGGGIVKDVKRSIRSNHREKLWRESVDIVLSIPN
jgi:hypothetical protein